MPAVMQDEKIRWVVSEIRDAKKLEAKAKKDYKTATQALYNIIGENELVVDEDGLEVLTWEYNKDSERFDLEAFKAAHPEMYKAFIKIVPGNRTLRIK